MPTMTKEAALEKLFRSFHRMESFLHNDAPSYIIRKEGQMFESALASLREYDIDGKEYLKTSEGKAAYVIFCSEEEHFDELRERCGRCSHHVYIDADYKCEIHGNCVVMLCGNFDDCGKDINDRIVEQILVRCGACKHVAKDDPDIQCPFKLNMLAEKCPKEDE